MTVLLTLVVVGIVYGGVRLYRWCGEVPHGPQTMPPDFPDGVIGRWNAGQAVQTEELVDHLDRWADWFRDDRSLARNRGRS